MRLSGVMRSRAREGARAGPAETTRLPPFGFAIAKLFIESVRQAAFSFGFAGCAGRAFASALPSATFRRQALIKKLRHRPQGTQLSAAALYAHPGAEDGPAEE